MHDDLDAVPTLAEFLEVIAIAIPGTSDKFEGTSSHPVFTAKLTNGHDYQGQTSRVWDLNDATFAAADSLNALIIESVTAAHGRTVTLTDIAVALLQLLRRQDRLLADIAGADVSSISAQVNSGPSPAR
ncbi:hypothetical protein ACFVUS_24130 [Nocardia sp. NPDC058058]|uniref:hypothetical protein n=1 Tax=Nocardia sp. NPDC058058 TaxID=3346317 RepID=UPI0036D8F23C